MMRVAVDPAPNKVFELHTGLPLHPPCHEPKIGMEHTDLPGLTARRNPTKTDGPSGKQIARLSAWSWLSYGLWASS
jgi:hypothetical protein